MEIVLISIAAFITALLTFFSGFGLGTILTPVFAIFFPIEIAIALTGVVHFSNNIFKIALVGKNADKTVLLKFGIPAIFASFAGAWLLLKMTKLPVLFEYSLLEQTLAVTPIKLIIAILLITFSLFEISKRANTLNFGKDKLILGGILSGFFGGLSGIQGAIRSAFLLKSGLSKDAYIATGVVIACLVDFSRLSVYFLQFASTNLYENLPIVISATFSAFAGALIGKKLLKKVTFRSIQLLVAVMIIIISLALGSGII